MRVAGLYRYPVKGLSPERLDRAALDAGAFFPGDRLFGFADGPSGFDPNRPEFQPKTKFLMLMRQARLAALDSAWDEATNTLSLSHAGMDSAVGNLATPEGRLALETFLAAFCKDENLRGPPELLVAPNGFRFTDSLRSGFVSVLNLASIRDIEEKIGAPVDPLRFRANVVLQTDEPWQERHWVGKTLACGDLRLHLTKSIVRCAAVEVRPGAGRRDLDILAALRRAGGHVECGVYGRVDVAGALAVGDAVDLID